MADKEKSFENWCKNLVKAPGRILHAGLLSGSDVINTGTGILQDIATTCKTTKDKIVDLFSQDKKWYQKLLNLPVAGVVGLSGLVEAAVKPAIKGCVNAGKTVINAPLNLGKAAGTVFSAKPISEVSYSKIKTKKREYNFDTSKSETGIEWLDKRAANTKKSWFDGRGKRTKKSKEGKAAAAATAATATAAASTKNQVDELKKEFNNKLNETENKFKKQIEEALATNKKLAEENKTIKEKNAALEKQLKEALEKKSETPVKPEPEKKGTGGEKGDKAEKPDEKKEQKGEVVDAKRVFEMIGDKKRIKSVGKYMGEKHPSMEFMIDETSSEGSVHLGKSTEKMIIGTKDKRKAKIIGAHELGHVLYGDKVPGTDKLLERIKKLNKDSDTQFYSLSYSKDYDTQEVRDQEDLSELLGMFILEDGSFDRYLEKLQTGENRKLTKISKADADEIKTLCEVIISNLDPEAKVVKMNRISESGPVSLAA